MTQYLIKIFLTTALVLAVSEVSRRSTLFGGLLASLPVVSFLAMIWLYLDTRDPDQISRLSTSIFWLVLPSLVFFALLPLLLKLKMGFAPGFALATAVMLACYGILLLLLKKFGIQL